MYQDKRVVGDADPYKSEKIENIASNGTTKASFPTETKKANAETTGALSITENKTEPVGASIARPDSQPDNRSVVSSSKSRKSVNYWSDVVNNLKKNGKIVLYTNLLNTNAVEINDLTLGIEFLNGLTSFGKTVIEQPENMQELVKQVSILAGKEMRIKLIDSKNNAMPKEENIDSELSSLGIDINIIDN